MKLGDLDKAIDSYARAVALNDADWEAHRGLGVVYMLKARSAGDAGLAAKAIEQWRRSLEIKPDQKNAQTLAKMIETYSQYHSVAAFKDEFSRGEPGRENGC